MSGGTEQVRYFVSGEYEDENGTFKLPEYEKARLLTTRAELDPWVERPNTMDKVNLRTNVNANLTQATEVGVNIGYVTSTVTGCPRTTTTCWACCRAASSAGPTRRTPWRAGSCGAACGGNSGWGFYKPGEIFSLLREQGIERFTSSIQANSHPTTWLNLRGTVGYDINNRTDYSFNPTGLGPPFSTDYTLGPPGRQPVPDQEPDGQRRRRRFVPARRVPSIPGRRWASSTWTTGRSTTLRPAAAFPSGTRTITGAATQFAASAGHPDQEHGPVPRGADRDQRPALPDGGRAC